MQATWGDDVVETDWRLAAERCGNEILKINPDWFIIVEGIEVFFSFTFHSTTSVNLLSIASKSGLLRWDLLVLTFLSLIESTALIIKFKIT